jgi:predicted CxxxxCH...CXXCH cytochrome family protein
MHAHRTSWIAVVSAVVALAGCGAAKSPDTAEAAAAADAQCTQCHGGTDNATGAPPRDTRNNTDPSVLTVGRHTAHVAAGMACDSCHPARPSVSTPGHLDGKVDVAFGGVSVAGGATPAFDAATGSCSSVYCHGATLNAGGARPAITWTGTLGEPRCEQCHGFPPPAPHPQFSNCATCHPLTVNAAGEIVAGGKHVNGVVDLAGVHPVGYGARANSAFHGPDAIRFLSKRPEAVDCASCHGTDLNGGQGPSCNACHASVGWASPAWQSNCTFCHGARTPAFTFASDLLLAAPPEGVGGETSGAHVGAHQKHLSQGALSNGFACVTCHAVPQQADPLAHLDGTAVVSLQGQDALPAGVGNLPANLGTYAPAGQTCTVYCHGATLPGGPVPAPVWTQTGLACNACHGVAPKTGKHPAMLGFHTVASCSDCHGEVVDGALQIVDRQKHVNGNVDVKLSSGAWDPAAKTCSSVGCHLTPSARAW